MRSIIELVNFYQENKNDIKAFFKQQQKENFHSLREAFKRSENLTNMESFRMYMSSNESIIFWVFELILIIIAIFLIVQNGPYMDNVSVAFSVMFLLLPFGPIFSIILVFINRNLPENIENK